MTSCPTARDAMPATKSLATLKWTSASSRARRTSRKASRMFSSVSFPWPRRCLNMRWNLSVNVSNMVPHLDLCRNNAGETSEPLNRSLAWKMTCHAKSFDFRMETNLVNRDR